MIGMNRFKWWTSEVVEEKKRALKYDVRLNVEVNI